MENNNGLSVNGNFQVKGEDEIEDKYKSSLPLKTFPLYGKNTNFLMELKKILKTLKLFFVQFRCSCLISKLITFGI